MTVLDDLPTELLVIIIAKLHYLDAESLARTFSRRLYPLCLPFLRERIAFLRHARAMSNLFDGEGDLIGHPVDCKKYARSGVSGSYGSYNDFAALPEPYDLDFLELNGDMYWLQRHDEMAEIEDLYEGLSEYLLEEEVEEIMRELDRLLEQASALGLTVPKCFITFMRTHSSYHRLDKLEWAAPVGKLRKLHVCEGRCPKTQEGDEEGNNRDVKCQRPRDGYITAFQNTDNFLYYLYMDTTGTHCVLGVHPSDREWDESEVAVYGPQVELTSEETALGVLATPYYSNLSLWGYTFEHFIASIYFGTRAEALLDTGVFAEDQSEITIGHVPESHCEECRTERSNAVLEYSSRHFRSGSILEADEGILPSMPEEIKIYVGTLYGLDGQRNWRHRPLMRDVIVAN
jgi:hypothetical protein